jgi:alcohol dehydrogenase class IV
MACALLLPHVLRFNWIADSKQFLRLASAIDKTIQFNYPEERDVVWQAIENVENLLSDIGLPKFLSEINVSFDHLSGIVEEAFNSPLNQANPRQTNRKQVEEILTKIL